MLKRFALAALVVFGGLGATNGQADPSIKPSTHADKNRAKGPVASPAAALPQKETPPPEKEWAEQVIDKFLSIPDQIFAPPSAGKP